MDLANWIIFSSIIGLASISPGPNVIAVVVQTLNTGRKGAVYTILGNLIALFTIALAAAIGVGSLLQAAPSIFAIMKVTGGIYLAWMGVKMLRSSFNKTPELNFKKDVSQEAELSNKTLIIKAMLISYSNPKSILFLSAVFPAFLDQTGSVTMQFAVMFITIICIVSAIHGFYALMALKMKGRLMSISAQKWMARVSGMSFVSFGCGFLYDAQK